ncbi:MAG: D-aminoacyl-tRNA deacylase, partial [Ruaniaceae bacterium]|nr:D-aminoacyl-tRNA deacylase [Ruaniaceae bacterium]
MRAVIQRVHRAQVAVDGQIVGAIGRTGLVALVGVTHSDDAATARALATKIANLRVLEGELSAIDAGAPVVVVSQFT